VTDHGRPDDGGFGPGESLTAGDITALNGQAVARAAAFARLAGTALAVAGAIGLAAWLWTAYRMQVRADDFGGLDPLLVGGAQTTSEYEVTAADRIDLFVSVVDLAIVAALAAAIGLGLRLIADYTVARTGGSLTGFEAGDRV
jgi:hypothetical protein